jgi:hypothetical protein
MATSPDPVVLDLAPLPKEKMGPFIILGVAKEATPKEIESAFQERLLGIQAGDFPLGEEDIHWAKERLSDPEDRLNADVVSMNAEILNSPIRRMNKSDSENSWSSRDATTRFNVTIEEDLQLAIDAITKDLVVPDLEFDVSKLGRLIKESENPSWDPWNPETPE